MAHITYADAIAIFQLVYYSPCLFCGIYVALKHGAMKSSGWIFLTIFCIIRLIEASARIATVTNPTSNTAYTIALVCSVLGLSPLLMASLGLISRIYYSTLKQPWSTIFSLVIVKIVHTPAVIALILCIVGATSASSPSTIDSEDTVKIGVILFTVVLVMLVILTIGACSAQRRTGEGEGRLLLAVICALPFLAIRLLYALLSVFAKAKTFSLATESTRSNTAALFMSVLEEMAVVVIYIAAGLKLSAVPAGAAKSPGGKLAYRFGRGDFGTGKLGILSLGTAAFQAMDRRTGTESQQQPYDDVQAEKGEHGRRNHGRR